MSRAFVFGLGLALMLNAGAVAQSRRSRDPGQKRMADLVDRAFQLPSNQIDEKIKLYTEAIAAYPSNHIPWLNRGVCYLNHGRWDDAIKDATEAIRVAPEEPLPWSVRARAYAGKRLFDKAETDLNQAMERARKDADRVKLYNEKGNVHFSRREYDLAMADFRRAVDIDDKFSKGWNNLGLAYRAAGDLDRAFGYFDRAIALDTRAARSYANRARIFMAKNDRLMTQRELDEAVRLDRTDYHSRLDRGIFRFTEKKLKEAREDLEEASNLAPGNGYIALWRFLVIAELENRDAARKQLEAHVASAGAEWPTPIAKAVLGKLKEEELLALARREESPAGQREYLAEAHFYLGQAKLLSGDKEGWKKSLETSIEQRAPRVHEATVARVMLNGWQAPTPPPPRSISPTAGGRTG
jgi:tetratricopeptide (TPR) repeat protein